MSWPARRALISATSTASMRLVWPEPSPISAVAAREHDRVRARAPDDRPGEQSAVHLLAACGARCVDHAPAGAGASARTPWTSSAPGPSGAPATRGVGRRRRMRTSAQVLLRRERVDRRRARTRARRRTRGTASASASAVAASTSTVERHDAAERRQRVGLERARERVGARVAARADAARLVVLDDHARRARELADQRDRGVEVEQVVVGELLALDAPREARPTRRARA